MSEAIRKFRLANGVPIIELPGQRRVLGGRHLDGSIWLQVQGSARVYMPPKAACELAIGILAACGVKLEETNVDNLLK